MGRGLLAVRRPFAPATALAAVVVAMSLLVTGGPARADEVANQPPTTVADTGAMHSGESLTLDVLGNDSDPDGDPLTLVSASAAPGSGGTVSVSSGRLVVKAAASFVGTLVVTYVVQDGRDGQAEGTATITVTARPNRAPVAKADKRSLRTGSTVTVAVLANDSDPDKDGLTLAKVTRARHGSATVSGSRIRYASRAGFVGTDRVTYTVRDSHGATDTATLTLTVLKPTQLQVERALSRLGLPVGAVNGRYDAKTRRAVCAWRTIVGRTARRALPSASESRAIVGLSRLPRARALMVSGVNISRTCQTGFWVSKARTYKRVMAATTGKPGYRTRTGTFTIFRTHHTWRRSTIYRDAWMYKPMQFSGGQAIHGSATDRLVKTYPASHGCVRMLHKDIDALQRGGVGNGTKVRVFGTW